MAEQPRSPGIGTGEDQTNRVANGLQQGAQQNGHVVAVPGPELEHPPGRVQHLHPERILGVSHVPLHPPEQRLDLSAIVLGPDSTGEEHVDRVLPHVEVFRAIPD